MTDAEKEKYKGKRGGVGRTIPMYHEMSDDEFLAEIRSELADELEITEEEVEEMSMSDIEDKFEVEEWGIRKTKDRLGGLLAYEDDPYDYPTKKELNEREEKVTDYLRKF